MSPSDTNLVLVVWIRLMTGQIAKILQKSLVPEFQALNCLKIIIFLFMTNSELLEDTLEYQTERVLNEKYSGASEWCARSSFNDFFICFFNFTKKNTKNTKKPAWTPSLVTSIIFWSAKTVCRRAVSSFLKRRSGFQILTFPIKGSN